MWLIPSNFFNNLLPYTFLVNSIPYYIRLLCSDKTVWLYCCFNCAMTLYIPLRSDKTHEEMFGCQYVPFFISHYVQIKLNVFNQYLRTIHLYIPLRSDKTSTLTVPFTFWVSFISHYVQIKRTLHHSRHRLYTNFISHYVQIKLYNTYELNTDVHPLYPTTFR